jgi:hypothetical protein
LSGWFRLVEVVKAIVRVGADLRADNSPTPADWRVIQGDELLGYPLRRSAPPPGWEGLRYVLNTWLQCGNVRPEVSMLDGSPSLTFGGDTWSTLGFQVVLSVTGAGGTAVCDGCRRVYPRPRKPQRGRRNFCQVCQEDGTDARMRQRDYAARHPDKVLTRRSKGTQGTLARTPDQATL